MIRAAIAISLFTLLPVAALADPVGTYDVVGQNSDGGGEYRGTAVVTRTGETYSVKWDVAGTKFVGTGLGAKFVSQTRFQVGVAAADDVALSVGYVTKDGFGMAMYFEQEDGHWEGVWTFGGSDKAMTEQWFPR